MKTILAVLSICFNFTYAMAGSFDCSVVYDEFDSLMNKQFLLNPDHYVRGQASRISRNDYNSIQKGKFLFKSEHTGYGVAIVHTNKNTWGKFLYTWGAPVVNGHPSLIIKDLTLFGRVLDGYSPRFTSQVNIATSFTYDLDAANGTNPGNNADIWFHNVDGNTMYVEAVNGAELFFPLESICK